MEGKVTGIGGIFFVAEKTEELKTWYATHLGITSVFYKNDLDKKRSFTEWNIFQKSSPLFKDYDKPYCWKYQVDDLDALLSRLAETNIGTPQGLSTDEHGKSAFLKDPDGNKIILWQPSGVIPNIPASDLNRVTGLGGVFFKTKDTTAIKEWYKINLGFDVTQWGCAFDWIDPKNPDAKEPAATAWSPFKDESDYFNPSLKPFMLNYRVDNLKQLLSDLKDEGVDVLGPLEESDYGNFGKIMDPEGNKIELWESGQS